MSKIERWELKMGTGEIGLTTCIGENSNLTFPEKGYFFMSEEDAIKEGHRRYERIRFFLCGPKRIITWNAGVRKSEMKKP